ncbi:MAG: YigZ family protein [Mycoplasmatota bacterium]
MTDEYKTIKCSNETIIYNEIVIKKSRFIAHLKKVSTEEEAIDFVNKIKKKHYDAKHNCSAFIIGSKKEILRCSDDREPSGTAGLPMLEILTSSGLVNVACVVTRYFGGILLGTGGLCHAYKDAVKEVLKKVEISTMVLGDRLEIITDYNFINPILYEINKNKYIKENISYDEKIISNIIIPFKKTDEFIKLVNEISSGKSIVLIKEKTYFEEI